jgi:hypothetical protein
MEYECPVPLQGFQWQEDVISRAKGLTKVSMEGKTGSGTWNRNALCLCKGFNGKRM